MKRENPENHAPNERMLRRTLVLMLVCGIVAFIVLILQLFRLQILGHEKYESMALHQQLRQTEVKAPRGRITDRNGNLLAVSADVYTVFLSPAETARNQANPKETPEFIASGLAEILDEDYQRILEKARDTKSWYKTVATKVDEATARKVRAFKAEHKLQGIKLESDTRRVYPNGSLACHVLGFVGAENKGLSGVEAYYDERLQGRSGSVSRLTTAGGTRLLFTGYERFDDPQPGSDVTLTIDQTIQYYVEKHLRQAVEDYGVRNGAAAIAVDVNTMEVLALASLEGFDCNRYQAVGEKAQAEIAQAQTPEERSRLLTRAQQAQWRCKAISDTYEPGSTFKILTLSMALNEGVTDLHDHFFCSGQVQVAGDSRPRKCWKTQGHGSQTLTQAAQHSCNVAFVNLGLRVGPEAFYRYCSDFGLMNLPEDSKQTPTAKTGLDLWGESGSIWWSKDVFFQEGSLTSLAAASFGQTFTITPMQLITAVSACVNGGRLMKPHLLKAVHSPDGALLEQREPELIRQVIRPETSAQVRQILEQVVGDNQEGTGRNAYVSGYRIGGKTGTSENVVMIAQTGKKEYIVSFVGFAPADDPKIAVLVLLDSPAKDCGVYVSGGQMAAPTVGNMLRDILPYMGVAPEYTGEDVQTMDRPVPALVGMGLDDALVTAHQAGFACKRIGAGTTIQSQAPAAGAMIQQGSTILLYTEQESQPETVAMPNLRGLSYTQAGAALEALGLFCHTRSAISDAEPQVIAAQAVPPGTAVARGTVVHVSLVSADEELLGRY